MGWSFPTHREVKAHMEEQEREARKKITFEPPTLVASLIVLVNAVISRPVCESESGKCLCGLWF